MQANSFTIEEVINECATFDIVDLTGFVHNLHQEVTHEKDGKILRIWKGAIKDQAGGTEIVLFNSVTDKVSNNTYYHFKIYENLRT